MKKLSKTTPDITQHNIDQIGRLFPQVLTEKESPDGTIQKAVDYDLLKQLLSKDLVEGETERYRLDWPGKKRSLLKANTPITKTLRPDRASSVNFDTTENIYIEGDNFETLKILQENYLGAVKMIYIDPPYNTGKDFVYKDNFTKSKDEYDEELQVEDEDGGKLIRNTDTNGRFHSDWLSMMYERLIVARDLLREDGVIFISIDDNEVHNLRKICDEVMGEENFLAEFIWKKRTGSNDSQNMTSLDHDYVIAYGKTEELILNGVVKDTSNYKNPDNDPEGPWARDNLTCNKTASERPNLYYPITDPNTGIEYKCNPNRVWAYEKERMNKVISEGKVLFPSDINGTPMYKRHLKELRSERKPFSSIIDTKLNTYATKEMQTLMNGQYFDYPKSTHLLSILVEQATSKDDIILDFFSGSSTTAHSVMQLNAEDGGNRKYIMVQIPEETPDGSEARKAGYNYITEIGKERIRRAGKKIQEEYKEKLAERTTPMDTGFRVFTVDTTNMQDVSAHPTEIIKDDLFSAIDNIKPDRTPEDLLTETMLKLGVALSLHIQVQSIQGKTVYVVQENALIACFDTNINESVIDEIAKRKPFKAVFRDSCFTNDKDRINLDSRFTQLSPDTQISVI